MIRKAFSLESMSLLKYLRRINKNLPKKRKISSIKGLSLIELLITLAISSIIVGVIAFTLQTCLDTFFYVQDDIFLQKVLDETLQTISGGDYQNYGVEDSLEIIDANISSIAFVPLWVDDTHISGSSAEKKQEFILNYPFKAGATLPIGEVLEKVGKEMIWRQKSLTLLIAGEDQGADFKDRVYFNESVPSNAKVRFIYHPDSAKSKESIMTMRLTNQGILREYRNKKTYLPAHVIDLFRVEDIKFQYFDNLNKEIQVDSGTGALSKTLIPNITALRIILKVGGGDLSKEASAFFNIRNTRSSGLGIIIRKGTELKIPNSSIF